MSPVPPGQARTYLGSASNRTGLKPAGKYGPTGLRAGVEGISQGGCRCVRGEERVGEGGRGEGGGPIVAHVQVEEKQGEATRVSKGRYIKNVK